MQYKSKTRKLKFNIPQFGLEIPAGKAFIGINVVIEDFYLATEPLLVEDKLYPVADLLVEDDSYVIVTDILLNLDTSLAMKYRFVFNDPGSIDPNTMVYSEFSIPTSFYGDQEGVKLDGLTVLTPNISIEEKLNMINGDILHIKCSEFNMPVAKTFHKYTNWKIYNANDTDDVIFQRRMDKSNLTELELDLKLFQPTNLYVIECSYVSEDNVESLTGRYYYNRAVEKVDVVDVAPILPFYIDYDWYYKINIQTPGIEKIGFYINYVGNKEKEYLFVKVKEHDIRSSVKIPSGVGIDFEQDKSKYTWTTPEELKKNGFNKYGKYRAYYYLIKEDGTRTEDTYIHEFEGKYEGRFAYPDVKPEYGKNHNTNSDNKEAKYTAIYPIETGDFICSSQELMGGVFMLGNYMENSISFFKHDGLVLRDLGFKLELPNGTTDESGFPVFSVLQANDGFIYINYPYYYNQTTNADKSAKRSAWLVGKLNPVTYEFYTLAHTKFEDELIIKSPTKAVTGIDGVYYIPDATLLDVTARNMTDFNTKHLIEVGLYHIRPTIDQQGNISLVRTKLINRIRLNHFTGFAIASNCNNNTRRELEEGKESRNIYILGGLDDATNKMADIVFEVDEKRLIEAWKKGEEAELQSLGNGVSEYPDDPKMHVNMEGIVYGGALKRKGELGRQISIANLKSISVFERADGLHVIFNDTITGDITKCNSRWINLRSRDITGKDESNDMKIDIPFTNTVMLRNGGFIRLTSEHDELKHALYYPPYQLDEYYNYEAKANEVLIVRRNERVRVVDLTKYSKVIIEGDNLDNTGRLTLIDNGVYKHFDFRDLIITRDTFVTEQQNALNAKHRLYLLPGVKYEISK